MTITNELLSTTLFSIRDQEVDALFKTTPFLDQMRKLDGIEKEDGGIKIQRPIALANHSVLTGLPTGGESLNMSVQDVTTPAIYNWADLGAPIFISRKEQLENNGDKAIVKIAEARMRNVLANAKRQINVQLLAGSDTQAAAAGLNTLYGHSTVTANGFIEGLAVASQTNTVGGIAKTTTATGWHNQFFDAGDAFGTNGLVGMNTIWTNAMTVGIFGPPNLILAHPLAFANYKRTLFANERYVDEKTLDGGRMALAYGDAMVEPDSVMPTSATNDQEFSMYFLNTKGVKLVVHSDADFSVGPFADMTGAQIGRIAYFYAKLQLVGDHLGSLGALVDGNTY